MIRRFIPIFALAAAVFASACSDGPTAMPAAAPIAELSLTPAQKAMHDQLMRMRDSIRTAQHNQKDALKPSFDVLKRKWDAFKHEWAEAKKDNKNLVVELLHCAPLEYFGNADVIGPNGGELHIGPHKLVIPRGALTEETLVVGEAPMGSLVQVTFGPHGLHFMTSAKLTLSYAQCMRPANYTYRIVYTDDSGHTVLEFPPSKDDKTLQAVTAPIDHFSSYMVAY